jgi:hypothetical protein
MNFSPQTDNISVWIAEFGSVSFWGGWLNGIPLPEISAKDVCTSSTWKVRQKLGVLQGSDSSTKKIVKSNWSWTATVSRSGTSNSTLRPRTSTYQSRGSHPVADWNLRNGSPLRPAQTGFRMAPEYSENGQFGSFAGGGVLEMMLFCAAVISGRSACTETPSVPPEKPSM